MLASILPGLREIRAPLAAGYLWLFGIWLMLANSFLAVPRDETIGGNIRNLLEYLGPVSTIAALSFLAYLLGLFLPSGRVIMNAASLVVAFISINYWGLRGWYWKQTRLRPGARDRSGRDDKFPQPKFRFNFRARSRIRHSNRLGQLVQGKVAGILKQGMPEKALIDSYMNEFRNDDEDFHQKDDEKPRDTTKNTDDSVAWNDGYRWLLPKESPRRNYYPESADILGAVITNRILQETEMLSEQLFSRNRDAYGRLDRLNAESEFRSAIFTPLGFIAAVLSCRFLSQNQDIYAALTWMAFGLSAVILYRLRNSALSQTTRLVVTAILIGDIIPPEIAFLDGIRDRNRNQSKAGQAWVGSSQATGRRARTFRGKVAFCA